jgi:hypothetical protein
MARSLHFDIRARNLDVGADLRRAAADGVVAVGVIRLGIVGQFVDGQGDAVECGGDAVAVRWRKQDRARPCRGRAARAPLWLDR